jgi:hypothetical protein
MPDLLIRLLITIGVIWLVQVILGAIPLREPANRIIFVITVILMVIWMLFGYTYFPLR